MTRGFFGRCPACGRGRLFRSYLKVVNTCKICGEDVSRHRADDAPAYLTLLIVAHGVGAGILLSDETVAAFARFSGSPVFWLAVTIDREPPHPASRQGRRSSASNGRCACTASAPHGDRT